MTVVLRRPRPTDQGYVASTWVRSATAIGWRPVSGAKAGREMSRLVARVLERRDTRVLVAAAASDLDRVVGWVAHVAEVPVPLVHYVYVRQSERRAGVCRRLLEHVGVRRDRAAAWTCEGPALDVLRAQYPAAVHLPLKEFLSCS